MVPVQYHFQWPKTAVCWLQVYREQLEKKKYRVWLKSIVLSQNCKMKWKRIVVLKGKKSFLYEEVDKNVQFNFLFLRNFQNFYLCPLKAGGFFIWWLKKIVRLKQCPLYGFRFRNIWMGSIEKTDGIKRVCPSQQGLRYRAWPIYAGFTHCLMIICKYLVRLSA